MKRGVCFLQNQSVSSPSFLKVDCHLCVVLLLVNLQSIE